MRSDDHHRQRSQRTGTARRARGPRRARRRPPSSRGGRRPGGRTASTARRRSRTSSASARSRATRPRPCSTPITRRSSPPQDNGITPIEYLLVGLASCLTAGVASVAQNRGIQLRSVESTVEGNHDIRGILGVDSDVRNGFNDIKVTFTIDADASQAGDRGAGRPVPEALGGVRRPHESDGGHRRGRLRAARHRALHHRRHRRRARRPRRQPLPQRAVDRPRRARARRGGELVAARALGLAAAADAQLAEPAAGRSLRRRRSRRLHDGGRGRRARSSDSPCTRVLRFGPARTSPRCGAPTTATSVTTSQGELQARAVRDRKRSLQPADGAGASQTRCRRRSSS